LKEPVDQMWPSLLKVQAAHRRKRFLGTRQTLKISRKALGNDQLVNLFLHISLLGMAVMTLYGIGNSFLKMKCSGIK
jgi:hypothetical protein